MASKTVNDFARELKLAPELLLEQLRAAGVAKRDVTDERRGSSRACARSAPSRSARSA